MINDKKNKNHINSDAGVYLITCTGYDKNYIGDTPRSIKKRIYEHIRDFKILDERNE